eukprot:3531339-Prymnesium_polylepis.1
MEHIPSNMRIASAKMSNYARNRFRLETVSSDTAGPTRVVSCNLPEGGALIDSKSFKMMFDVTTTSVTTGTATVAARLPADASSLISRVPGSHASSSHSQRRPSCMTAGCRS